MKVLYRCRRHDAPGERRTVGMLISVVLTLAMSSSIAPSHAASTGNYPNKPVRMIVAFAPGGSSDIVARVMAQHLGVMWGHQVVVDNRPGASGMLGHAIGARAPADGYTIVLTSIGPLVVNPMLYKNSGYDPVRSFAPVTLTVSLLNALVVHPSVPANSVKELIAYAKARPGQVTYGSSGIGGAGHLAGELFGMMAGVKLVHVPYKGGAPAMIDLVGGQIQIIFATLATALPHMRSGKIRALAVTTKERVPLAADLPTIAEAALPGFEANNWDGMLFPASTPKAIVSKVSRDTARVLSLPEVRDYLSKQGALPTPSTPESFAAYLESEIGKWRNVVQRAGIRAE
jgi:tripartite-type tricarboxylate transporter receptor subunit TctC